MKRSSRRWLGVLALVVAIGGAPAVAQAGTSSEALLELAAERGPAVGLGFGVSPLHWELMAPPALVPGVKAAESATLADLEPHGRAISLDLKLRWPGTETATTLFEPYLVLGPALFLEQPQADPILRLGAKAGAGFNWRLSKDTTLFGAYDVTTAGTGAWSSPGVKGPAASETSRYDVLYGVRFRY